MLSFTEGTFNNDMAGFVMRIGKKDKDDKGIHDVLIYDHSGNRTNDKMVHAADGIMGYTPDKKYLSMKLANGISYEDVQGRSGRSVNAFPFMRTSFKSYDILFNMEQFKFQQTPQEQFGQHQSMKTLRQLLNGIDSLSHSIDRRIALFDEFCGPNFFYRNPMNKGKTLTIAAPKDTLPARFIETIPAGERSSVANHAHNSVINIHDYAHTTHEDVKLAEETIREYWLEIHLKFSLAYACLMFLFIGAPMGAIIRKGGFGWPILVSILFFVGYMVLLIVGKKLAKEDEIPTFIGAWFPNILLTPMGVLITYQALRDSALFNLEEYTAPILKLWHRFVTKQEEA
jgi:lipopolysaccharide export system permease protein